MILVCKSHGIRNSFNNLIYGWSVTITPDIYIYRALYVWIERSFPANSKNEDSMKLQPLYDFHFCCSLLYGSLWVGCFIDNLKLWVGGLHDFRVSSLALAKSLTICLLTFYTLAIPTHLICGILVPKITITINCDIWYYCEF